MKMTGVKRRICPDSDSHALCKELDEISCPICMEHPHNAVLLLCTSHEKGCKSYICDTSYRHSNCLDRFKKLRDNSSYNQDVHTRNLDPFMLDLDNLKCPLCRGNILGWKVVEEARIYLNSKRRSCSHESCSFFGTYQDLRRHARRVHPTSRPSDVDPIRERTWRSVERQQEYGDVVSAIRSAIPGAVVVGDYVIENGERSDEGRNPPWWTTFFLFQMLGAVDGEARPRSQTWARHRRPLGGALSQRRSLWGENHLQNQADDNDNGEDESVVPRRRRRLTRSRSSGQS